MPPCNRGHGHGPASARVQLLRARRVPRRARLGARLPHRDRCARRAGRIAPRCPVRALPSGRRHPPSSPSPRRDATPEGVGWSQASSASAAETRRGQLVRREGQDVSTLYGREGGGRHRALPGQPFPPRAPQGRRRAVSRLAFQPADAICSLRVCRPVQAPRGGARSHGRAGAGRGGQGICCQPPRSPRGGGPDAGPRGGAVTRARLRARMKPSPVHAFHSSLVGRACASASHLSDIAVRSPTRGWAAINR